MSIKSLKAAIAKADAAHKGAFKAYEPIREKFSRGTITEAEFISYRNRKDEALQAWELATEKYKAYLEKKAAANKAARAAKKAKTAELAAKAAKLAAALELASVKTKRKLPQTREEWLMEAVEALKGPFKVRGYEIPAKVKCSIGFPSTGARGKAIGECWGIHSSKDGSHEIFLTPFMDDPMRILDVLVHELGHACVGIKHGHRAPFKKFCKALNLEGKPTATVAGPELIEMLKPINKALGKLPHAGLSASDRPTKKQSTRMIKCECPDCGAIWRTSRKVIEAIAEKQEGRGEQPYMNCVDPDCIGRIEIGEPGDEDESEGE